jgi:ABC-type multidrug transport system ATPase subunit
MLTGSSQPTHGHTFMLGHDVRYAVAHIYGSLAVCHQEDILWGNLSARDHVLLARRCGRGRRLAG